MKLAFGLLLFVFGCQLFGGISDQIDIAVEVTKDKTKRIERERLGPDGKLKIDTRNFVTVLKAKKDLSNIRVALLIFGKKEATREIKLLKRKIFNFDELTAHQKTETAEVEVKFRSGEFGGRLAGGDEYGVSYYGNSVIAIDYNDEVIATESTNSKIEKLALEKLNEKLKKKPSLLR